FLLSSTVCLAHKEKWDDDKSDWTPLMLAIYNGETETFINLIDKSVNVTYRIKTSWQLNALNVAIFQNSEIAVKKLVETKKFPKLDSYLESACSQNSVEIVDFLIKRGAKATDTNGKYSKLMSACSFGTAEIVK